MQAKTDKIILGLDPGTSIMGYGIIHIEGKSVKMISMGTILLHKYDDHGTKLKIIFERTLGMIDEYKPDEIAAEAPFFGKNVQSMLKLGRAQGVALAAALFRNIPIFEYSPRSIKQSITGRGSASKEQVAAMLQHIFKLDSLPSKLDATDGLAAAVCHYFQGTKTNNSLKVSKTKSTDWSAYINQNPERIKKQP
jgi:crossover junction endodeoxyribonuclease RuvC